MSHGTIASSYLSSSLANLPWTSGAAGAYIADNSFAVWRGTTVDIATVGVGATVLSQTEAPGWVFGSGMVYENWLKDCNWAFGAIVKSESQTWASAAAGSYDSQWTTALTNLRNNWNSKSRGQMYIRFAHDMNGDWTQWSVEDAEVNNFKTAWIRFYNIKQSVWPAAKLVFAPHGNSVGPNYDWRTLWPGDAYVDVYGVFWHSNHWQIQDALPYDEGGGPQSLLLHQQFAIDHNKPFAIDSWCVRHDFNGDAPTYIDYMYNFFAANYGTGAGQLLYESYYNDEWSPHAVIYPEEDTQSPLSAARYKELF